jgi:malonyl-CoA O-methyltransferase
MSKNKIISRFNKAAHTYDEHSITQKESALLLAQTMQQNYPDFVPQTILDLGTGTGVLVEEMLKFYPRAHYTLNDNASNMLTMCQKKFENYTNFSYLESDMQTIPSKYYDLILSNFSLQWANDPIDVIKKSAGNCKIFAFTCVLNGTFNEWYKVLKAHKITTATPNFLSQNHLEEVCKLLSSESFYFTKNYKLQFKNYRTFANYLKSIGASATDNSVSISNFKNILKLNSEIETNYKVFFGFLVF